MNVELDKKIAEIRKAESAYIQERCPGCSLGLVATLREMLEDEG